MQQEAVKPQSNQPDANNVALVGRQTIYNRKLDIYGYELLYRPGENMVAEGNEFDGCIATGEVMLNTFMEIGLETLVEDKFAFINLTQEYVEGTLPIAFDCDSVVLEVLEDIDPTPLVIEGIERLKSRGFTLALDDFVFEEHLMPLVPLVDIIKIDIMGMSTGVLKNGIDNLRKSFTGKLLAEKIENQKEFDLCISLGFDYFQGYFLEKPVVVKGQKMPSNQVATIQLLGRLQDPNVEYEELEGVIKNDPSLSFKLLRYINSPSFNLDAEISSIKQALMLLGLATLKRWMTLIVMSGASDKSPDIILKALSRAYMCEQLSKILKLKNQNQYFLVGLFSILDAMLGQEKSEILSQIPLPEEFKMALLENRGNMGKILKCVVAYEHGDWKEVKCGKVPLKLIQKKYLEAIHWANEQATGLGEG